MIHKPLSQTELLQLLANLTSRTALIELAVLLGCLGLAWLVTHQFARGTRAQGSIWYGERLIDGWVFPLVALLLALAARRALLPFVPIAVFKLAVPLLFSLLVIRFSVRVLRLSFPQSEGVRLLERWISWVAWIGMVLWVTGVLPMIQEELGDITLSLGTTKLSVRNIVEGALSVAVVMIVTLWVSAAIESRLLKGASAQNMSVRKIVANATRTLMIFVGLIVALSMAGIDLTALSVFGGAIGVGLGFGLQKLASNYVSGFVVLAERSLRIGDLVKVDNFEGYITDINTRYTVIRAGSGRESIVPNEMLITQRVENASLADPSIMLTTIVQVAYGTDIPALTEQLAAEILKVDRVMAIPAPGIFLTNFASDGLELTINFWISEPQKGQASARSAVNLAILRVLNENGIDIPFPQRVVRHIVEGPDGAAVPVVPAGEVRTALD